MTTEGSEPIALWRLEGDPEQLQAIDAGAAFKAITEQAGFSQMWDIRRQKKAW